MSCPVFNSCCLLHTTSQVVSCSWVLIMIIMNDDLEWSSEDICGKFKTNNSNDNYGISRSMDLAIIIISNWYQFTWQMICSPILPSRSSRVTASCWSFSFVRASFVCLCVLVDLYCCCWQFAFSTKNLWSFYCGAVKRDIRATIIVLNNKLTDSFRMTCI